MAFGPALPLLSALLAANPYLDEGRALYDTVRYAQAEPKLKLATEAPESTVDERRQAFDLYARCLMAMGRTPEAQTAYAKLLAEDPEAPPPGDAAPKIRELFQAARRQVYPPDYVRLSGLPSAPGRVEADLLDPWGNVAEVLLQVEDAGRWTSHAVTREGRRCSARLPPAQEGARWALEARAADGRVLASLGRSAAPSEAVAVASPVTAPPIAPGPPGAVAAKKGVGWAVWTLAAVAVAAAVTSAALGISSAVDSHSASSASFGSQTRDLDESARRKAIGAWAVGGGALAAGAGALVVWSW